MLIYRPPHTHASVAETCKPLIFISVSARFARRNLLEVMGIYQRFGSLRSPNKCLKPFHRVAPMLAKKNQGAGAAPRPPTKKYRIHFPYRRKKGCTRYLSAICGQGLPPLYYIGVSFSFLFLFVCAPPFFVFRGAKAAQPRPSNAPVGRIARPRLGRAPRKTKGARKEKGRERKKIRLYNTGAGAPVHKLSG